MNAAIRHCVCLGMLDPQINPRRGSYSVQRDVLTALDRCGSSVLSNFLICPLKREGILCWLVIS